MIVEGSDDLLVLRDHISVDVSIFPANGRKNAITTAKTLLHWGFTDFVCVTDHDFDQPVAVADIAEVHYPYDRRDLESMLVTLGVLAAVLDHQGSQTKIATLGGSGALVQRIEEQVEPVTRLRAHNAQQNLGLAFDEVDLANKVDRTFLSLAVESYCAALVNASEAPISAKDALRITDAPYENLLGHAGKDTIAVAGVSLRKLAGTLEKAATAEPQLSAQVRSSAGLALAQSDWLRGLLHRLNSLGGSSNQ
ncbi:hypothetical protein E1263_20890 [Kribbella antibiotica]|uniref:DUF4435 domain-containing protein n=1 Tax=Kribbella antibiotica TaxID=190195 RepID=A0A4R4ZIY4_9ACTN|nr:hypothetical protein [Kribbella antibiotica]TDD58016.1 hypothetical protein E1263_20890 [Kribbella antibiotica]